MSRSLMRILLLAIAVGLVLPASSLGSFCGSPVLRDYEEPLRRLPGAEPLPQIFPFGPPGLELWNPVGIREFAGFKMSSPLPGKRFAYMGDRRPLSLRNRNQEELKLQWTIKVSVSRVSADGSVSVVSEVSNEVESLPPYARGVVNVLEEELPGRGTFRIDFSFWDSQQRMLGSYFEFARVVPRVVRARVRLAPHLVQAGKQLVIRWENLGTMNVVPSGVYRLQRYHEGGWRTILERENRYGGGYKFLSAGHASGCQRLRIPMSADPGLYRIVGRLSSLRKIRGKVRPFRQDMSATFRVTGRPEAPPQRQ
jgi:hypothetical protein